jgi:hypothetical protein
MATPYGPAKGEPGYRNRQPRFRRHNRQLRNLAGIRNANRNWIALVRLTLLDIPSWSLAAAIPGLSVVADAIWLSRKDARKLAREERESGGRAIVQTFEFRRCEVCRRPLVGAEAEERRRLIILSPEARRRPCGPNCAADRKLKVWSRLTRRRAGDAVEKDSRAA